MKTMQSSIFFLLLLGVSLGLAAPPELSEVKLVQGTCPMSWFNFNGRCYKYVSTRTTWADAEIHCVSQSANLVSIHNLEEHNFVKSLIQNFDHTLGRTWIGLSDIYKEKRWIWTDGCPVVYTKWNAGEPNSKGGNEDCVEICNGNEKNWNDEGCSRNSPSVCASRKPDC
ncbi:lactose-binding lectin l-2-like [Boleophthalmus pectinirostris]|uniref:lactose-binding lectin l-2-like n=1 Tax=Boleophthalmus pectinirostris TaxID=150288 RepID=UPI0024320947|nr:lactose-binding lectin l-2-like [Boleophthalmus pectinirostris]